MRRRLLSNRGLDEYLVFQTKSYDTTFDACLKNMPDGPGYVHSQKTHWDKVIPKTQTYTTIKIYSKNKKYTVSNLYSSNGTVYIGTSLSSTSTTYTSTSLGATETTLYINHGVTPANYIGNRQIYLYIQEDGLAEDYGYRLLLMQERTLQKTFSIRVDGHMPYKATNPIDGSVRLTGLSTGTYSNNYFNLSADKLDNIYKDTISLDVAFDMERPEGVQVYGYDNLLCRVTVSSSGDWDDVAGSYISIGAGDLTDGVLGEYDNGFPFKQLSPFIRIVHGNTQGGVWPGYWWYGYPYYCTFAGSTGGGNVTFEFYDNGYEIYPEVDSKTGRYILPEDKKFLEVGIEYGYQIGVSTPAPPKEYNNLITFEFVATTANNDNRESKYIRSLVAPEGKEEGILKDFFSNHSAGSQYVVFGVWKYVEGKTDYGYSDALWKLVFGSPEHTYRFGFYKTTDILNSSSDFSYYGCDLVNGSNAIFADDSYRDYGNINDIRNNLLQFSLKRETIDSEILSKIGSNDKLVVGMYSPYTLNTFRNTSHDFTDGVGDTPAIGWRKDGTYPYWYSQVFGGDIAGNRCTYSVIDASIIKSGTTQGGWGHTFYLM